jgi:hypothetical protein
MATPIKTEKCPICKKEFVPAPYHAYRERPKGRLVCSYHCALESDRRKAAKKKIHKKDEKGVKENEI